MLAGHREEDDRGDHGHDSVGDEHAGNVELIGRIGVSTSPDRHADVHGQRSEA